MNKNSPKIIIVSGYFDPIHIGHLDYFKRARELGDYLIAIVNNDSQLKLKRNNDFIFQKQEDRLEIVRNIKTVDESFLSIDDDISVCKSIKYLKDRHPNVCFIFAKGGDRFINEIPESKICKELGIEIIDGLGEKIRNSSDIISKLR